VPAPVSVAASGKAAPAAAAVLPSDPKALMMLAVKTNGLTGPDVHPWHLKATYQLLDEKGSITDHGTYEEFYVSPTKFKRTYASTAFTLTEYGTEKGVLRSGARNAQSIQIAAIHREFVNPMPSEQEIEHESFELQQREASGGNLTCLTVTGARVDSGRTYCLAADKPILRIAASAGGWTQALHNRIVSFQGHFIAQDLRILRSGKLAITAQIDVVESLNPVDEIDFTPSPDAMLVPQRIDASAGVTQGHLLSKTSPSYPPAARSAGVSGTVVLQAVIGLDGHIEELRVISGPLILQQAAIDAVRAWVYKPFLVNSEPVEINTTINVVFALGIPMGGRY
jgi:TonB family protein